MVSKENKSTKFPLFRRFNNIFCPDLKGKPKFFIVQACRGEAQDFGLEQLSSPSVQFYSTKDETDAKKIPATKFEDGMQSMRRRSKTFSEFSRKKELSWEDMVIAFSTLPGYVSNRDTMKGTWFVESLCRIFSKHSHNTPLRDMLDMVINYLIIINN